MSSKNFESGDLVWAKMKGYPPWPGKIMVPPSNTKPKKNHHYVFFFGSDNHAWIPNDCIELHNDKLIEKHGKRKGSLFQTAVDTIIKCSKGKKRGNGNTSTAKERADKVIKSDTSTTKEHADKVIKTDTSAAKGHADKVLKSDTSTAKERADKVLKSDVSTAKEHADKVLKSDASTAKEHADKVVKSDIKTENVSSDSSNVVPKKIKKKLPKKVLLVKTPLHQKKRVKKHIRSPDESEPEASSSKVIKTEDIEEVHSSQPGGSSPIRIPELFCPALTEPLPFKLKRIYVECPKTPAVDLKYCSEILKKKKIVPTKKKIGFLGLGLIGIRIVKNLFHSGHKRIMVWNKTPEECKMLAQELDVKIAPTPSRVVQDSHIIFCCVPDTEFAIGLIFGPDSLVNEIERSAGENKGFVQMTSMGPRESQGIGNEIRMKGGRYLEAPFCGSRTDADEGTLLITAAGDKTLYDECKSCFDAMSKKHLFVSAEVGTAFKLNIVHNMLIGTAYAAAAESLAVATQSGVKGEDFFDVLQVGSLNCASLLQKVNSMLTLNYVTDIPLKQMQQDLSLGLSLGHEISQCSEVLASANQVYKHCKSINYGEHDVSAVYEGTKP